MSEKRLTVRAACRRQIALDGADAQALEHALTITERERDAARAEVARLRERITAGVDILDENHFALEAAWISRARARISRARALLTEAEK